MMQYELPRIRPPSEARSLLVRATRNCPWSKCIFCYGIPYNREKFELRPVEDVKNDIRAMKEVADEIKDAAERMGYGDKVEQVAAANGILWLTDEGVKTAFIGDSNSLIMKTDDLIEIIRFLYETFPTLERVTSYARGDTARKKSLEDLKRLHEAGLTRLHLGLETGDDELLEYIRKGATADEMIEAGKKVKESGISISEYIILGMGGKDKWQQHAVGTARVLNAIDPDFIRVRTLMVLPGTPLEEKVNSGEFKLSSTEDILREERLLIELLGVHSQFVSDHVSNYLPVEGKFPDDKEKMLESLDQILSMPEDSRNQVLQPESMRHI
ncbi:MAG: radical SAM protein [Dehalococcoidia bacterium]